MEGSQIKSRRGRGAERPELSAGPDDSDASDANDDDGGDGDDALSALSADGAHAPPSCNDLHTACSVPALTAPSLQRLSRRHEQRLLDREKARDRAVLFTRESKKGKLLKDPDWSLDVPAEFAGPVQGTGNVNFLDARRGCGKTYVLNTGRCPTLGLTRARWGRLLLDDQDGTVVVVRCSA